MICFVSTLQKGGSEKTAFFPINYSLYPVPEMVAHAAKAHKPKIMCPYRCGNTDTDEINDLPKKQTGG
jgi:hypothetical protein